MTVVLPIEARVEILEVRADENDDERDAFRSRMKVLENTVERHGAMLMRMQLEQRAGQNAIKDSLDYITKLLDEDRTRREKGPEL